jgi:hypothetical protein
MGLGWKYIMLMLIDRSGIGDSFTPSLPSPGGRGQMLHYIYNQHLITPAMFLGELQGTVSCVEEV